MTQPPIDPDAFEPPMTPTWGAPVPEPTPFSSPGWDYLGPVEAPPEYLAVARRGRGRAKLIAACAVVVLVGGGVASYVAVSQQSGGGAGSPQSAVRTMVKDLDSSDLLGALDDLAPGERDALVNPFEDGITQEKRLHVLSSNANPSKVSALTFEASGLTFGKSDVINNHVQIVTLTGGQIVVNSDLSKLPFTSEYLKALYPKGVPSGGGLKQIDISTDVQQSGSPIRLAAEKVGGRWYPSILYTIADNITHSSGTANPGPAQYIPAEGASSPQNAVQEMAEAAVAGDGKTMIELTSPVEMAALHDYGGLFASDYGNPTSATIKKLQLSTQKITGGERVLFHSVTVDNGGQDVTVTVSGNCLQISQSSGTDKYCSNDVVNEINSSGALANNLTSAQASAIEHLVQSLPNIGIDTSESAGQWYVNPLRSVFDSSTEVYSALQGNDLIVLMQLVASQDR